ncbi:MAG: hypothetical protein Q8L37_06170 [Candidatus Gottesmanbacteria bacterium]|nr:hypothetical protein [Candidatus Gottesmanbacteria bacterium]
MTDILDYQTWFNQQIATTAPKKMDIDLPSQFQIGDEIEIVVNGLGIVSGTVFAIKFSGNGTVNYDLAIPIASTSHYTIINDIRGSMRKKGEDQSAEDLNLIGIEEILPNIKRSMFHLVE